MCGLNGMGRGLVAGLTRETMNALLEVFTSGKIRELLAQGMMAPRYGDRDPEAERLEKQRQVPFHMQINYELLEAVYYTAAMLQETATLATESYDPRRRPVSKPFRRLLEQARSQLFTAPPENVRDHLAHATRALLVGDWRRCRDTVLALKTWDLLLGDKATVTAMLSRRVQEEGLRVYMLAYGTLYDTVSLARLAAMFELSGNAVQAVLSRMIFTEELAASLDPVAGVVIVQRTDPSRLRALAMQYADKVCLLYPHRDRETDRQTGTHTYIHTLTLTLT
jgi:translation initiation factor 3 subunit C